MIEQRELFSMQPIALRGRANANIADFVRAIRVTLLLRFSLAAVFFWFGMLKLAGVSPVVALLQSAIPFLARAPYIELIGVAEIVIAIGLSIDRFSDQAAALMILHLFCTLSLAIIAPTLVFAPKFPLLTMDGEFLAKNFVLITAGLVVISSRGRRVVPGQQARLAIESNNQECTTSSAMSLAESNPRT